MVKSFFGKIKHFFTWKKIVILIVLGVVGFFLAKQFLFKKESVESTQIQKGIVSEELILSGQVNADEYSKLSFQTSGKIAWVGVKEGEWVKNGAVLAKLDTVSLNSAYQSARATLRAAEATVANIHDQVKDHSADETFAQKDTRTTYEAAKDRAYEAVLVAEDNLKSATLSAPFEGLISYVANPSPGITVVYSTTQFELINPKTIYFEVSADQTEVVDIKNSQQVKLVLDSYPDEEFSGEVSFVSFVPKTGEAGAVYKVKVAIKNTELDITKFRIGMTGDAKFILSQKENTLFVPPKFLKSDQKGKYLFKGDGKKVYVQVGLESEERVELSGDISEGLTVVD